eukprot:Gb_05420 [translate_table: standard]
MAEPRYPLGCRRSLQIFNVILKNPVVGSGYFPVFSPNFIGFCIFFIFSYVGTFVFASPYEFINTDSSERLEVLNKLVTTGSMSSNASQRSLDSVLQDYAFKVFKHPKTGIIYDGTVPTNLSGMKVDAVRLRSGSLRRYGILYNEFDVPTGVEVKPYVRRLVLVYQNFVNWSSVYYNQPGFQLIAPVLGLLAYNASNLSATNLHELNIVATKKPILIRFTNVSFTSGLTPMCIFFDLNGTVSLSNVTSPNVCSTFYQGHFSLVTESLAPSPVPTPSPLRPPSPPAITPPSPSGFIPYPSPGAPNVTPGPVSEAPTGKTSNTWKIAVGSSIGGVIALVLLGFFCIGLFKYREKANITQMEHQADQAEALQTSMIAGSRAPTAAGTRTQPLLENEYVA